MPAVFLAVDLAAIALCRRNQVLSMPGALTPTEIVVAMQAGADTVKVFPAENFGPACIKALRATLPQAPRVPTGGVSVDNLDAWFANGAAAGRDRQFTARLAAIRRQTRMSNTSAVKGVRADAVFFRWRARRQFSIASNSSFSDFIPDGTYTAIACDLSIPSYKWPRASSEK